MRLNMSTLELGSGKRRDEGIVRDANYVRSGDLCLEGFFGLAGAR
jgi:hypothetical protein